MLCSRFIILLIVVLSSITPFVMPKAFANIIVLNDTLITDFFDGVATTIDKPIVISKRAELFRITGEINLQDPYKAIKDVADKTNLIYYNSGSAIYVYSSDELKSQFITVYSESDFNDIINYLKLAKLYDPRYPMRYTKGAAFVSGPPMYVKVVTDAVNAYYNGLKDDVPVTNSEIIRVFPLENRFVTDMKYYIRGEQKIVEGALTVVKKLLESQANILQIVADPLNNALYAKGPSQALDRLEALIKEIDIVREQIQLSLWIIDIDSSEISEIGASLEGAFNSQFINLGLNGGSIIMDSSQTLNFVGKVSVLEEDKKAKVLSRPILITQNNTPAVIDTNETIYVRLLGENDVALKEITYGTILSVTPRVIQSVNDADIEMMVEIEDGNQTSDLIDGIPNIRRSVVSTVGRIKDSQSLLLGGFVRKEVINQNQGIPLLKDIPLLKYIFSMDVKRASNVMRLFMIEPKIIKDPVADFERSKIINLQSEAFYRQKSNELE